LDAILKQVAVAAIGPTKKRPAESIRPGVEDGFDAQNW